MQGKKDINFTEEGAGRSYSEEYSFLLALHLKLLAVCISQLSNSRRLIF